VVNIDACGQYVAPEMNKPAPYASIGTVGRSYGIIAKKDQNFSLN
jgi:hypothetical protein